MVITAAAIVDAASLTARSAALSQAATDQRCKRAIVSAMKTGQHGLPTPKEVETRAARGALTASMLGAWLVAEDAGLLASAQPLLKAQCALIEQTLLREGLDRDAHGTLTAMLHEYRTVLAA